jgi:hypothetical protein
MSQWQFDPPGFLTDFTDPERWHEAMLGEARDIAQILVELALGRPASSASELEQVAATLAYANPVAEPPPASAETIAVAPWGAFPRAVRRRVPWDLPPDPNDLDGTLRAADHQGEEDVRGGLVDVDGNRLQLPVRHRQDEYCEWALRRDSSGNISKAIFVAEGYDYFARLFEHDPQRVVDIYREFTESPALTADDLRAPKGVFRIGPGGRRTLVEPGKFNPRNRHNISPGIVHLSHSANSLGAEVNLAGVSGILRRDTQGKQLSDADAERLLCCAQGGNPNRNSDPLIGAQAYRQVLDGFRYTLANPVGLYIAGIEDSRLFLPDGTTQVPLEWWRVIRGSAADRRILRLELSVPSSENLTVSDLLVDGNPVRFGGQLADLLTVHLFVTRWKRTSTEPSPIVGCDATCCRQDGGTTLVLSDGGCAPGSSLAFPDLVPPAGSRGALAASRAAAPASSARFSRLT